MLVTVGYILVFPQTQEPLMLIAAHRLQAWMVQALRTMGFLAMIPVIVLLHIPVALLAAGLNS